MRTRINPYVEYSGYLPASFLEHCTVNQMSAFLSLLTTPPPTLRIALATNNKCSGNTN